MPVLYPAVLCTFRLLVAWPPFRHSREDGSPVFEGLVSNRIAQCVLHPDNAHGVSGMAICSAEIPSLGKPTRCRRSPRRIAPLKHVPEKSGMRSGFAAKPMRHLFTWASSLRQNRKGIPICMRTCFCRTMRREQRGQPVGWPIFNVYQPSGCPRAAIFQALSGTLLAHGHAQPGMSVGPHHASVTP